MLCLTVKEYVAAGMEGLVVAFDNRRGDKVCRVFIGVKIAPDGQRSVHVAGQRNRYHTGGIKNSELYCIAKRAVDSYREARREWHAVGRMKGKLNK